MPEVLLGSGLGRFRTSQLTERWSAEWSKQGNVVGNQREPKERLADVGKALQRIREELNT